MIGFIQSLGWLGLIALIFGLIYVTLAARSDRRCWYFGIISCAIIAYEDIFRYDLYADAGLQAYYVFMGFWGLATWKEGGREDHVFEKGWKWHLVVQLAIILLSILLGIGLSRYTGAALPFLDTWTSIISVVATWMLVHRIRSNWIYWIVANTVYIYIYGEQGAVYYMALMIIYLLVAVNGWRSWSKLPLKET
jgi:nicotinamide mononucleotide transporter